MNPCIDCPFTIEGCHEIGFDEYCEAWQNWKWEWKVFKLEVKERGYEGR